MLESWNFKIDGQSKILQIESKTDGSQKEIKMIDTQGGHYGIILETRKKKETGVLFLEDTRGILFLEDAEKDLCSYKVVRKVHKINHDK